MNEVQIDPDIAEKRASLRTINVGSELSGSMNSSKLQFKTLDAPRMSSFNSHSTKLLRRVTRFGVQDSELIPEELKEKPKELLAYFKKMHNPLKLNDVYQQRHGLRDTQNAPESSESYKSNIELLKINQGNYTLGCKSASYYLSSDKGSSHQRKQELFLKDQNPWVQTRWNIKNSHINDIRAQATTAKKLPKSKKTYSFQSFSINEGFRCKNKKALSSMNSSQVLDISNHHSRKNSTMNTSVNYQSAILPSLTNSRRNSITKPQAKKVSHIPQDTVVENSNEGEISKRKASTSKHRRPRQFTNIIDGQQAKIDSIDDKPSTLAMPEAITPAGIRYNSVHVESLNAGKFESEIGYTYPQILQEARELKKKLLSCDEKEHWADFKLKDIEQYRGLLKGESRKEEIEKIFKHLQDIHKQSQLSADSTKFSDDILNASMIRKVADVGRPTKMTPEEYDSLRKKSDQRLAFMFVNDIESVKSWLAQDIARDKEKREISKKSVEVSEIKWEVSAASLGLGAARVEARRRWQKLKDFLLYLVRQNIESVFENFNDCSFYTTPNGYQGVDQFFVSVKTGNTEKTKVLSKVKPLFLYCFDAVIIV